MNICLIPARKGSKRIKNKNIKNFNGKPIIYYSIKAALNSRLFDKIIVSTDCSKIKKIAIKAGAEVPFLRPKILSGDKVIDREVIKHFLNFSKINKWKIRLLCYLYPVNPLIKTSTLKKCYNKIKNKKCDEVITLYKYSFPIELALTLDKDGFVKSKFKKFINMRSQNFSDSYMDAAQCYWYNIKKNRNLTNLKTLYVKLNKFEFVDVDNYEDLKVLKKIYDNNLHK